MVCTRPLSGAGITDDPYPGVLARQGIGGATHGTARTWLANNGCRHSSRDSNGSSLDMDFLELARA
jgi:hypothetical protein